MKLQRLLFILMLGFIFSCSNDDDTGEPLELRDPEEVRDENMLQIEGFLETHFYRFEDNPQNSNFQNIIFDTIAGDNANEEPVINSEFLKSKLVFQQDVEFKLYYLKFREGAESVRTPTFADSVLVTYRGFSLFNNQTFDGSPNPLWFDLTNNIRGFYEVMDEFKGSTSFQENPDGTISFDDNFGIGTVFIPSGIAYYSAPPSGSGIAAYEPIVFNIQLYRSIEADHDQDGVPSWMEDINEDRRLTNDDTDGDNIPDFADVNDDGDGTLTEDEIEIDAEGNLILPDSNGNDTPDYLDPTFPEDA
ncbi:hypothetical protein P700755_003186 [Psychroflexus torquis ATCC 700755]|uniref:Peptidylprolyl isomerase n=1 Tax=Psychroflexus torquis (strain ATCC 700755 / CIP 106069 / ACAM 623) TaxID=313595 RepID=K4IJ36_PSYTT|nr:hypothetical protein [Psychroflexus torquis]AFU69843.1 hypothetical protein P700755_003186 [Psychroflexus torquis ATCC 700755]